MRKDNMMKDAEFNICQLELRETKQQLQHAVKYVYFKLRQPNGSCTFSNADLSVICQLFT